MISINEVIEIHAILIEKFGGSIGIRDLKLLESAILRPYQTFDNNELYPSAIEKAAALIESIVHLINYMITGPGSFSKSATIHIAIRYASCRETTA